MLLRFVVEPLMVRLPIITHNSITSCLGHVGRMNTAGMILCASATSSRTLLSTIRPATEPQIYIVVVVQIMSPMRLVSLSYPLAHDPTTPRCTHHPSCVRIFVGDAFFTLLYLLYLQYNTAQSSPIPIPIIRLESALHLCPCPMRLATITKRHHLSKVTPRGWFLLARALKRSATFETKMTSSLLL